VSVSRVVTPAKIEAAVKRLVEVAHPSRIILFGSAARGALHRDSDVDLLVVLPDEPAPSDGAVVTRMYSALADIPMSKDIIVVSEERLAELGDRPSLVYREALRTGKVVYEAPRMSPRRRGRRQLPPSDAGLPHTWLAHARSDLVVARLARSNSDVLPEQACFHAQQAVEKAVKAVLLARNVDFPYTHNLEELVNELTSRGLAVPIDLISAKELTRYAALTRYPHSERISEAQVDQAIEIAETVVSWAIPLVPTPGGTT
jgi:HEPN domain-containing protein/predicted nucleotidyltransferase